MLEHYIEQPIKQEAPYYYNHPISFEFSYESLNYFEEIDYIYADRCQTQSILRQDFANIWDIAFA